MRSLVGWLLPLAILAGCRGPAVRPTAVTPAVPAAQLRTRVSIEEAACGPVRNASAGVEDQLAIVRELSERADARFLAEVRGRVPFTVAKSPWKDRPVIELSLEELRVEPAPPGSADPGRVQVLVALRAELPDARVSVDRKLAFERPLDAPLDEAASPVASLSPAVEEAAALAAAWLVEAAKPR